MARTSIKTIKIPEGVTLTSDKNLITASGKLGEMSLSLHQDVDLIKEDSSISFQPNKKTKESLAITGTMRALSINLMKGVSEGFTYKMKAVYSHFPMTMKVDYANKKFIINNYFGEKVPREASLPWPESEVKVEVKNKTEVIIFGQDKEKVGQTTANIERSCTVKKRDRRVFQDGIYLVEKN